MEQKVKTDKRGTSVGPVEKRQEMMEDGRRYIIYFTFGEIRNDARPGEAEYKEKKDV